MDRSSALTPNSVMGAISPIQSGAPLATFQPAPVHSHNFTWKRSHSSFSAVSVGFIAAAALISLFLIIAVFETLLRRPSLRTISIHDRNSDDSQAPATEFSAKRDDAIIEGITRVSVLMPGQLHPTFVACPAPVPRSHEEISLPTREHGKAGSSNFDTQSILNLATKYYARPSTPTYSGMNPAPVLHRHEDLSWPTHEHNKTGSCSFDIQTVLNLPTQSKDEANRTGLA